MAPNHRWYPWMVLIFSAILTIVIASCAGQSSAPSSTTPTTAAQPSIPSVTIKAMDFSFDQPQTIPAGLVDLTLVNNGAQPHQIQLVRINDGNFDEFASALKKNGPVPSTLQLVTGAGGANVIDPGGKQEVILNLTQGEYASICFVSGSDNVFHYMKGMLQHLSVTGSPNTSQAQPHANTVITLKDFAIEVPKTVTAGAVTWKVMNDGPQLHEMGILKLHSGVTFEQFHKLLSSQGPPAGPPPFDDAGGIGGLQPGTAGWMKLNLQPGNYVALCFVPDVKTGKPHFMFGMMAAFTVV
jgi:hypothetical protein